MSDAAAAAGRTIDLRREPDFQLGTLKVAPSSHEVSLGGWRERLEPRVMQVLVALARADGALVTKEDLFETCWDGRIVAEDALHRCVAKLRRLSETRARGQFGIETVSKAGYRLTRGDTAAAAGGEGRPGRGWVRPGLIVAALVVAVAGGGLAWRLIALASHPAPWSERDLRMTFVMARAAPGGDPTLAAYADQFQRALAARFNPMLGDARVVAAGQPASYAIGLEFRRAAAGVVTRVTLRDRPRGAVLDVREVADLLGPSPSAPAVWSASSLVKLAAIRHDAAAARAKPPGERDARDLLLMAMVAPVDRSHDAEVMDWIERAQRLAPGQPMIGRMLATALDTRATNGWSVNADADIARARALAEGLLRDNPEDAVALTTLNDGYLLQGRWEDALVGADRLLAIKPDDASGLTTKGQAQLALGRFDDADDTVARLLPFQNAKDELQVVRLAGLLRFHQGRYAEAADFLRRAAQLTPEDDLRRPASAGLRLYLAVAEAEAGQLDTARADLKDFRAAVPALATPADFRRWNDPVRFPLIDGDRLAPGLARIGWTDR